MKTKVEILLFSQHTTAALNALSSLYHFSSAASTFSVCVCDSQFGRCFPYMIRLGQKPRPPGVLFILPSSRGCVASLCSTIFGYFFSTERRERTEGGLKYSCFCRNRLCFDVSSVRLFCPCPTGGCCGSADCQVCTYETVECTNENTQLHYKGDSFFLFMLNNIQQLQIFNLESTTFKFMDE